LRLPYRRQQLQAELAQVEEWHESTLASLDCDQQSSAEEIKQTRSALNEEYDRMVAGAKRRWGTEWWKGHPSISPLRGALATWGLTVDDIGIASCHGTSTKLNDKNESDILNTEMEALGRQDGNPLFIITQKWLTGHPKGPAAAWQAGGVIQAMLTGKVPGNRNLDNVDADLNKFKHLLYTSHTLDVGRVKAACVTSFGFGQAGGQMLLIHPDYFLATLPEEVVGSYEARRDARRKAAHTFHEDVIAGRRKYVEVKSAAPYPDEQLKDWLVQRNRRVDGEDDLSESTLSARDLSSNASDVSTTESFNFTPKTQVVTQKVLTQAMQDIVEQTGTSSSVGVDVESVTNPCFSKETFLERNYTERERLNCGSVSRSFAGLWAGKEAVVKVLGNAGAQLKSAGSSLRDIELIRTEKGSVTCQFHGFAAEEAARVGVHTVVLSISYADNLAVAAAVAK